MGRKRNKKAQRIEREERKRRLRKKRRKRMAVLIVEVLILAALGTVAYGMIVMDKMDQVTLNTDKLEVYKDTGDYTNIALFGLDSRKAELEGGVQSDCIMVASINNRTNEVKLVSVYRDTLLRQEGKKYEKANSAYTKGGPEAAIALLNRNLDLDIQKYISVNFNALADVVDALGGIEIDMTEEEVFWTNGYGAETSEVVGRETTELSGAGVHKLDGIQAVSYSRIRYTDGNDFKRTHRQRIVLEKIAEKAQQANLITLNNIINKVMPQISTNLTTSNLLGMAANAMNYKLGEMSGFPFEVAPCDKVKDHKGSYVAPIGLTKNVGELHQFLFGEEAYTPSENVQKINDDIIYLTGINPDTYGDGADVMYRSNGNDVAGEGGNESE